MASLSLRNALQPKSWLVIGVGSTLATASDLDKTDLYVTNQSPSRVTVRCSQLQGLQGQTDGTETFDMDVPSHWTLRVDWPGMRDGAPCIVSAPQHIIVTAYRGLGPNRHLLAAHPIEEP